MSDFDTAMENATESFLNTFGDTYPVQVTGEDDRSIEMIINYEPDEQLPAQAGKGVAVSIEVKNDVTEGISSSEFDTNKFKAVIPWRIGATPTARLLTRILSQDAGMVTYQVR